MRSVLLPLTEIIRENDSIHQPKIGDPKETFMGDIANLSTGDVFAEAS